jgi:type IV pilus assembly protein PilO
VEIREPLVNLNDIIDRLSKIPRNQRMAIYAVLYVILAALYISLGYLPKSTEISELQTKHAALEIQLGEIEQQVSQRDEARARMQNLKEQLIVALQELPEDREIPGLLKGISSLARKAGLEILRFQPLSEEIREYVAEIPVALEVEGNYHDVAQFFDALSDMDRIVYVQDIEMQSPEERGGKVYLRVTGNVVTFRFLSEEEIEAGQSKGKGKGKSKGKRGGS